MSERSSIYEKMITKINDYYETNLRVISVRGLGEQMREMERQLEQKANILEVKKLLSSISKYLSLLKCDIDEAN